MLSPQAFFHLSSNKTHLLPHNLPLLSHRTRICGSSHGWLVILDETPEVHLLNPVTRATLALPPMHIFPNVVSFRYSTIGREYLNDDFVAFAIVGQNKPNLAFCRKGSDSWDFLGQELDDWEDVVYSGELFFTVSKRGNVAMCGGEDSLSFSRVLILRTTPLMQNSGDINYVVFSGKDMLLVTRVLEQELFDVGEESNLMYRTVGFEVF
ncbi:F-box protein [Sesbania bispinosa]|nr:F-box protein [Sesbania bispinosa]